MPNVPIRILMVDDQLMMRAALRLLIEQQPGIAIVGEAATAAEALAHVGVSSPDVVLMNLELTGDHAFEILPTLFAAGDHTKVIVMTSSHNVEGYQRAVRLGAMGVVLKEKPPGELIKAIEKVHIGEVWLDRRMTAGILNRLSSRHEQKRDPAADLIATLTARELQVIDLVVQGLKNKQIGDQLSISETTVSHHLTSTFSKLSVNDRFDLVMYAYRHGMAKLPL
ncbi:MAG: LuxR C-terminal-related transcriptional regulator [Chloroflexia bacterium]